MDKLEKALEKSRMERASALPAGNSSFGNAAPTFTPSSNFVTVSAPSVAPAATGAVNEARMEDNRIVAHKTRSGEADIYRLLRAQILQSMHKTGARTLAITSPNYGDGKTTVAINLAISIALDMNQTVLLVDLDLRKPNVHHYLGLQAQAGLTNHLLDGAPLRECLLRPPFERMNTLPAGRPLDNSSEILGSPRMIALAQELKARYPDRIIIYDMPPALEQDDPLTFMPQVDAVLVVVRDGVTPAADVKRCMASLAGSNIVGTVLNAGLAR